MNIRENVKLRIDVYLKKKQLKIRVYLPKMIGNIIREIHLINNITYWGILDCRIEAVV